MIRRWFAAILFVLAVGGSFGVVSTPATAAAAGCGGGFLTFPTWYKGISEKSGDDCNILSPDKAGGIQAFILHIVMNVIEIALQAVGYISVGFIIYGGYLYMIGAGSSDRMVAARKTIINAVVGLVISFLSVIIINVVTSRF